MKQTSNAIKFLMAQYRAVFKSAYFKGLATAAVVTAGLAAGAAQATSSIVIDNLPNTDQEFTVDSKANTDTTFDRVLINSGTNTNYNGVLNIISGGNNSNFITGSVGEVKISGTGALNISNSETNLGSGGFGVYGNTNQVTLDIGSINVNRGTLYMTDLDGGSSSGSITVAADTITVGDGSREENGNPSATLRISATATGATEVILGRVASGSQVGSTINVTDGGQLTLASASSGTISIKGNALNVQSNGVMLTTSGANNTVETNNFTLESGAFKVISGAGTVERFEGNSATINGNLLVDETAAWILNPQHQENTTGSTTSNGSKDVAGKYNSGSDDVVGNVTIGSGANVQLGGTVFVHKGTLTVEDGANLNAIVAPVGNDGRASIIVDGQASSGAEKAELNIGSATLKSFLASGDSYNAITTDDSGTYILDEEESKDVKGGVILTSGGRLEFSDTNQVNLSDFRYASGDGTKSSAGVITIGANSAVIAGDDIAISDDLLQDNGQALGSSTLHVSVNSLTLGDGTSDGLTQLANSGVNKITVRDHLTLNVPTGEYFKFNNNGTGLVQFINSDENFTAQVDGNIEFSNTKRIPVKGKWDFNGNWRFAPGGNDYALLLGGYNAPDYNTYVTLNGELINAVANGGYSTILVKAYKNNAGNEEPANSIAVLDLTNASLSSTNGELSGLMILSASINGQIRITGGQLEGVLTDELDGFALGATDKGEIYVNSSITGEHDFTKFIEAPSGAVDGSEVENRVALNKEGVLDINGDLSLFTGKNGNAAGGSNHVSPLNIGTGIIKADTITLTNYAVDNKENPLDTTFASGTLEVSEGLVVNKSTNLLVGENATDAHIILNADSYEHGGSLGVQNIKLQADSSLEAQKGVWSTTGDIYTDNGALVVGMPELPEDNIFTTTVNEADEARDLLTYLRNNDLYLAQFSGDNFKASNANAAADNAVLEVHSNAIATFNTMQLADSSLVSLDGGHLTVNGLNVTVAEGDKGNTTENPAYVNLDTNKTASTTAGIDFGKANVQVTGAGAVMEFGNVATNALIDLDGNTSAAANQSKITITKGGIDEATFNINNFGELKFNFDEGTRLETYDISKLLSSFKMTDTNSSGYLNLGNADLGLAFETKDGLTRIDWTNLKDFVNVIGSQATTDTLKSAQVYNIAANDKIKGHYGSLSVNVSQSGVTQLGVNGPLTLHNAAAFGGYFVVNGNTGSELGVKLDNGASLGLENGGIIGSITGNDTYGDAAAGDNNDLAIYGTSGVLTEVRGDITKIDQFTVDSVTEVTGNVDVSYLDMTTNLTTTGDNGSVQVDDADIAETATLTTTNFVLGDANNSSTNLAVVLGELNATNITLNSATNSSEDTVLQIGTLGSTGGLVKTNNLTLNGNSVVEIGYDPTSIDTQDDLTTNYDETKSYTGFLEVTGQTTLNGGELYVDPSYSLPTAMASLNNLSGAINQEDLKAGTLDGDIFVGRNSALGIGSNSLATLQEKVARFQTNGSLNADDVGAVVYLGKSFVLGAGQGLTLTAGTAEEFLKYYNASTGTKTFNEISETDHDGSAPFLADTVYLGAHTAILADSAVVSKADVNLGANTTAMIGFAGNGQVIADGGEIVVDGNVRASTYQVFSTGTTIKYIDNSAYDVVVDENAAHYDDNITVTTENEFLTGVVDKNGQVELGVADNGRAIMAGASNPVYTTLVAYAQGYNGTKTTAEDGTDTTDYLYNGYTKQTSTGSDGIETTTQVPDRNYQNDFLQEVISHGNGRDAETVARLGMLGGVAQSAMAAGASTYDAIAGRMGVGSSMGNVTIANNTQGASLWLTPIYKNSESDGFEADNLDYGVDIDLYGVALGADFTMQNGVRVGAMFNVGSGDADGNGAGSAVSNDFDYYGFGVYAGYTYGAFSVLADVTYTVADNDVEGSTSLGQVSTSLDSTNLSVGVTGQYNLNLGGVDVTPHAGLRFSSIDIDDYDVADIASYDADSLNIFSIPVGVTFAKEFQGEAWTWKPSLDITVQGNFGDDSADGTVAWAGIDNLKTELSSEVIDNFTYGATLGVAAQTGNFSMGLGINYTGSSNVDDYGVSANARFVF